MNRVAILATPRSGTVYTHKLLHGCGLVTTHEEPHGRDGAVGYNLPRWGLDKYDLILHQVRMPIKCIASLTMLKTALPRIRKLGFKFDPSKFTNMLQVAPALWLRMNQRYEKMASHTFKVETLVDEFDRVADLIGIPDAHRVGKGRVEPGWNSKCHKMVTWGVLRESAGDAVVDEIFVTARRYGYDPEAKLEWTNEPQYFKAMDPDLDLKAGR